MLGDGAIELYTYSSGRCVDIPLKDTNHKKYIQKKNCRVILKCTLPCLKLCPHRRSSQPNPLVATTQFVVLGEFSHFAFDFWKQ